MALDLQKSAGRQWPLIATMPFTYEDLASDSGNALNAVVMPVNSIIIGGSIIISEAFNSGTSDSFAIGDRDNATRYGSGIDGQATGRTALTLTGNEYTGKNAVTLRWTGSGADPTAGEGILVVEYMMKYRATEVEPVVSFS